MWTFSAERSNRISSSEVMNKLEALVDGKQFCKPTLFQRISIMIIWGQGQDERINVPEGIYFLYFEVTFPDTFGQFMKWRKWKIFIVTVVKARAKVDKY